MNAPSHFSIPREWVYLAPNPKSAYKQLFIKGTRIRAEVVYHLSVGREPMTRRRLPRTTAYPWKRSRRPSPTARLARRK